MVARESKDAKRVRERIAQVTQGLIDRDTSKIVSAYALEDPRFTAFEDHAPFKRLDGEGLRKLFEGIGDAKEMKNSKYDIKVDVYGDVAVATGYEDWAVTFAGGKGKDGAKSRFTIVYIRKDSDWFVIHEQFTRIG